MQNTIFYSSNLKTVKRSFASVFVASLIHVFLLFLVSYYPHIILMPPSVSQGLSISLKNHGQSSRLPSPKNKELSVVPSDNKPISKSNAALKSVKASSKVSSELKPEQKGDANYPMPNETSAKTPRANRLEAASPPTSIVVPVISQSKTPQESFDRGKINYSKIREQQNVIDLERQYKSELLQFIEGYKNYPRLDQRLGNEGVTVVSFTVLEKGIIANVKVTESSGTETLDSAAVDGLQLAAKFKPIPLELKRARWEFTIRIAFELD